MFVSDTQGNSRVAASFPYSFYAKKAENDPNTYVIQLVMPLGGKENGLFRYPKVGEKILIDDDGGSNYYLLGYLPDEESVKDNFLTNANAGASTTIEAFGIEKAALKNEEGMILRYQQTGKDTPSTTDVTDRYSEIGFYRRKTQWQTQDRAYWDVEGTKETDAAYSARLVGAGLAKSPGSESDAAHIARVTGIHDNWVSRGTESDAVYSEKLAGIAAKSSDETDAAHIKRVTGIHDNWVEREAEDDAAYSKRLVDAGLVKAPSSETDAAHIARVTNIHDNWLPRGSESDEVYSKRLVTATIVKLSDSETAAAHIARANQIYINWIPRIEATTYPRIDQINIHSTGDIHERAVNHHRIQAKRFEVLAGLGAYDHTAYPGADYEYTYDDIQNKYNEKQKELPFGDSPGDDSNLYTGDMHLRAKNRILIKAGDEVVIEVGRSSIVINDEGIALVARKGRKKTVNLWDTKVLLSPQNGINLFGQNLQMEAVNIVELKDNYGGSINSTSGILRIGGRDIKMKTHPTLKYLANHISVITNFSQSLSAMDGIHRQGEGAAFLLGNYGLIVNKVVGIVGGAISNTKDSDPLDLTVILHGILLSMNNLVVNFICDPKTPEERDIANKTVMIIDFSLNILFTAAILAGPGFVSGFTHNSLLHLRGSSHIELNSLTCKKMIAEQEDAAVPLAGMLEFFKGSVTDIVKSSSKLMVGAVIIGVLAGLSAAVLPGVYVGAIKETDKKTMDELRSL
jgi:hypothetical protein